ncbi:MAG: methyltransferase domain-containing protein [Alphaproteobacteria bacterium]
MNDLTHLQEEAEEHYRRGRLPEAAAAYQAILDQDPDHLEALEWRGEIAVQMDDFETAVEMLAHARSLRGDDAFGEFTNLGLSYYELSRSAEAVETLWLAVRKDATDLVSHSNLGKALYDLFAAGEEETARDIAAQWMHRFPEVPDAQHIGAAVSGNAQPETANPAYVEDIFNDYAPIFDEKLAELGYRAPNLILGALESHLPPPNRDLIILDAGCGTGLCAPLLSPYAHRLEGVDLSPKMLEKARSKEIYDALSQAELCTFLDGKPEAYDVIVAADVLCYFGDLLPVLSGFHNALIPTGRLGFTVEMTTRDAFQLNQSGRYKHNADYVRDTVSDAGLILIDIAEETLRSEYGVPVGGLVVTAARPRG